MKAIRVRKRQYRRDRGGFFSMELALTLPILGIVLMALFEFSMLCFARGEVVEASRVGARKAMLAGATQEGVENEIRKVLNPRLQGSMQVGVELGEQSGDVGIVAVIVPMNAASPDLLWTVGYSLKGRNLIAEARMIKE